MPRARTSPTPVPTGFAGVCVVLGSRMSRARRALLGSWLGLAVFFASRPSLAQQSPTPRRSSRGIEGSVGLLFDTRAGFLPRLPSMLVQEGGAKAIQLGTVPSPGSLTYLYASLGVGLEVNDRWIIRLSGVGAGGAVGPAPRVWTSVDGSIIQLHPPRTMMVAWELPGFGLRWKHRRWMVAGLLRSALILYQMDAGVAVGREQREAFARALTLNVSADIQACRRFDPVLRGCVFVAPTIYEAVFGNGGALGMRLEFGR